MTGQPSWFEIGVPDGKRARAFYAGLFAWPFHPMQGDQGWFETPTAGGGLHDGDPDRRIQIFFRVDDIDAAVKRVRELGGEADDPEDPEPDDQRFGRFAMCHDDQGVPFGLHQPLTA